MGRIAVRRVTAALDYTLGVVGEEWSYHMVTTFPSGETARTLGVLDEDATRQYPVVTSARLPLVSRRGLGFLASRSLADLPEQPPGTVLVYQLNDGYEMARTGRFALRRRAAIEAVAAVVVDQMQRTVVCKFEADAARVTGEFTVAATFLCWVSDPVLLLERGCWRVTPTLLSYVMPEITVLATQFPASDLAEFAVQVRAHMSARSEVNPIYIEGMKATFIDVRVKISSRTELINPLSDGAS